MSVLRERHRAGQTIVLVTHDLRVASAADRVIGMRDGQIASRPRSARASAGATRWPGSSRSDPAMLRAAARIIRADFGARPLQAILTGVVIAIAAGTLLVTMYMRASLDEPYDQLRAATNAADAFALGHREDVVALSRLPGVASAEAPRPLLDVPIEFGRERDLMTLVDTPGGARVDRPRLISGRAPSAPGEVLLDHTLADFQGVRAGSTLDLGTGARRLRLRVVGTGAWTHPGPVGWVLPGGVAAAQRELGRSDPVRGRGAAARPRILGRVRRGRRAALPLARSQRSGVAGDARRVHRRLAPDADDHQRDHGARPDRRGVHARHGDRRAGHRAAAADRAPARGRDHAVAGDGPDDRPLRRPGADRRAAGTAGRRAARPRPGRRHGPTAGDARSRPSRSRAVARGARGDARGRRPRHRDPGPPGRGASRRPRRSRSGAARAPGGRRGSPAGRAPCSSRSWSASAPRTRSRIAAARA